MRRAGAAIIGIVCDQEWKGGARDCALVQTNSGRGAW